jgi:hypothetical protein
MVYGLNKKAEVFLIQFCNIYVFPTSKITLNNFEKSFYEKYKKCLHLLKYHS